MIPVVPKSIPPLPWEHLAMSADTLAITPVRGAIGIMEGDTKDAGKHLITHRTRPPLTSTETELSDGENLV